MKAYKQMFESSGYFLGNCDRLILHRRRTQVMTPKIFIVALRNFFLAFPHAFPPPLYCIHLFPSFVISFRSLFSVLQPFIFRGLINNSLTSTLPIFYPSPTSKSFHASSHIFSCPFCLYLLLRFPTSYPNNVRR